MKLKVSFGRTPIAAVVLTSLLIFVLSTQFSFAACSWFNPVGCATDTFTSLKLLFSVEGIIDIVFRILNFAIDSMLAPLVNVSGWIFDWSLSLVVNANTSIVATGWGKSLDLANNLFILILLAIAIGTILELPTFNYKTMLPKFLMVALLINFSLAIGNTIIGATNVLAGSFYKGITSETLANRLKIVEPIKKADEKFKNDIGDPEKGTLKDPIKIFTENIFLFVYKTFTYLLVIFVFIAGAVYMIARTFHLWLLLMLAPLAWISLLIPGLQQHWKGWWSKFIKWSIFAPAYLFFLWLGVRIGNASVLKGFVSGYSNYGVFTNVTGYILQMLVVAFIMISGLVISSQLGVGGSNFVINYGDNLRKAAGKKFKDMRGKSEWSAEKIGEKFGKLGAGALAYTRVGAVAGYGKETREKLRQEKLESQQKKEELYEARQKLKEFREGKGERKRERKEATKQLKSKKDGVAKDKAEAENRLIELQIKASLTPEEEEDKKLLEGMIKLYNEDMKKIDIAMANMIKEERLKELEALRAVRKAAGSEKVDFEKELRKLLEKSGGGAPPAPAVAATTGGTTTP